MAAKIDGVFNDNLQSLINSSKLLVVGAGGIGCELLKNIVLTGFTDIVIIDLDTIDVSNLNRQFLFQKNHVGQSKAKVAKATAECFNPDANIIAHHGSITSPDYGVNFFKQFTLVLNALDNRTARSHVNRMCLAADVPLIESGTKGYLGQVSVIKKAESECYECVARDPAEKSYPGCTIRNTPSEPIHCIVWAKHLFNQLFGEADPDEDVSPDTEDPEAAGEAGSKALAESETQANGDGNVQRTSTREWAKSTNYDARKIFHKLFFDDIKYLLSMEKLWEKRKPPTPMDWDAIAANPDAGDATGSSVGAGLWTMTQCRGAFSRCVADLSKRLEAQGDDFLVWDKDDDVSMDFVSACANVRSHIFGIDEKSRFDVKSMAGNIIPAIATSNAIIAGHIVLQALRYLEFGISNCNSAILHRKAAFRNRMITKARLNKPNPKCYVCSPKPEIAIQLNVNTFKVGFLESKVLKSRLSMIAPDVEIDDGKGTILISSEEGETTDNNEKCLSDFKIQDGTRLKCDDFLQNYELVLNIIHCDSLPDKQEFVVVGDVEELKLKQAKEAPAVVTSNGSADHSNGQGSSAHNGNNDEVEVIDVTEFHATVLPKRAPLELKRAPAKDDEEPSTKKKRVEEDDDDVIII